MNRYLEKIAELQKEAAYTLEEYAHRRDDLGGSALEGGIRGFQGGTAAGVAGTLAAAAPHLISNNTDKAVKALSRWKPIAGAAALGTTFGSAYGAQKTYQSRGAMQTYRSRTPGAEDFEKSRWSPEGGKAVGGMVGLGGSLTLGHHLPLDKLPGPTRLAYKIGIPVLASVGSAKIGETVANRHNQNLLSKIRAMHPQSA